MIDKDIAKDKYFDGSQIGRFTTITPKENEISGWYCKARNHLYGSLLIDTVNGEEVEQFVRGMPKLHYYNPKTPITFGSFNILEKLDGTNIVAFAVKDAKGKVIEVCHKTRSPNFGDSMVNKSFMARIEDVWDDRYESLVAENPEYSFAFELYGTHSKLHNDVKYEFVNGVSEVNMDLISTFKGDTTLPYADMVMGALRFGIPYVKRMFSVSVHIGHDGVEYIKLKPTHAFINRYPCVGRQSISCNSPEEAIEKLRYEFLEGINIDFQKSNSGVIIEGAVWQVEDMRTGDIWLFKNKANGVHEGHVKAGGIPAVIIRKAVRKANENLDLIKMWDEDKDRVIQFIEDELKEEFQETEIKEKVNQNRIMSSITSYLRKLDPKPVHEEYMTVAKKVLEDNPHIDTPQDGMREFARNPEYAHLRRRASEMFNAFNNALSESNGVVA